MFFYEENLSKNLNYEILDSSIDIIYNEPKNIDLFLYIQISDTIYEAKFSGTRKWIDKYDWTGVKVKIIQSGVQKIIIRNRQVIISNIFIFVEHFSIIFNLTIIEK